jgi:hypothetical protein
MQNSHHSVNFFAALELRAVSGSSERKEIFLDFAQKKKQTEVVA